MKRLKAALLAIFMVASLTAPAFALDRVNWYYSLQPPSTWLGQSEKDSEYALGQMIWDFFGRSTTGGFYTNLSVVPASTQMYVQVQPTNSNQLGSLYQEGVADLNPFGGTGGGGPTAPSGDVLPADATQLFRQGLISGPTAFIGPLQAPTTSGFSVIDLIECQTQIVDQNPQSVNYVSSLNVASSGTANRDRVTTIVCQQVAGTPAASPTTPATDSGWVAIGTVNIPYGAANITAGMITASPQFNGFLPAGTASTFMDLSSNQTAAGNKTFTGTTTFSKPIDFNNGSVTFSNLPQIASDWQANPGLILNVASGSNGIQFMVNNALTGAYVNTSGTYYTGSSYLANNGLNVNGIGTFAGGMTIGNGVISASASIANIYINGHSGGAGVILNQNSGVGDFRGYDGGATNYWDLTYGTGLTWSGSSTSSYTKTDATLYGNLVMPNQAAGQCAQFDGSHHLVAAGGACGLTSGTISSVTSNNSNLLTTTSGGAVTLDFLHAPQFNSAFIKTPDAATSYDVYVGTASGNETKQNASPIAIGTAWVEPTSGLIAGSALPTVDQSGLPSGPNAPALTQTAGGTLAATTYYVKVVYRNNSGTSAFASTEQSLAVSANNVLNVASPNAQNPANSVATVIYGTDQQEALVRNGNAFKFQPWIGGSNPTLEVDGGFQSGSSYFYPTYISEAGTITGTAFLASSTAFPTTGTMSIGYTGTDTLLDNYSTTGTFNFYNNAGSGWADLKMGNLKSQNNGSLTTGSSIYGATQVTVNGDVVAVPAHALPNFSDGGSNASAVGTAYLEAFGGVNAASHILAYPCLASTTKPCIEFSGGDNIATVPTDAWEIGILGVKGLGGFADNGNFGIAGGFYGYGAGLFGTATMEATGTATSSTNYASNVLQFNNSEWVSGAAQTENWQVSMGAGGNLNYAYNGTTNYAWSAASNQFIFALSSTPTLISYASGTNTNMVINAFGGTTGDLLDVQLSGTAKFKVLNGGGVISQGVVSSTNAFNADSGASNGLGLQIGGVNVVYSDGGGSNHNLFLTTPSNVSGGGAIDFGYGGSGTAYGNIGANGYTFGSAVYGTSATVPSGVNLTGTGSNTINSSTTGAAAAFVLNNNNATPTTGDLLDVQNGGTNEFQIGNTGAVTAQGNILAAGHYIGSNSATSLVMFTSGSNINYLESGNAAFTANQPLSITGYNGNQGSTLTVNFANLVFTGATASTCAGFDGSKDIVSSANCVHSAGAGTNITNTGTALDPVFAVASSPTFSGTVTANNGFFASLSSASKIIVDADSGGQTFIESGNAGFTASADMNLAGYSGNIMTNLNLKATHTNLSGDISGPVTTTYGALEVHGSKTGWSGIHFTGANGNLGTLMFADSTTHEMGFYNAADSGWVMDVRESGTPGGSGEVGAAAFVNGSRREWKHDIHDATGIDFLNMFGKIPWSTFFYNKDHGDPNVQHLGYIANTVPSILSGPNHDHFDAEAVSTADAIAILQEERQIKVLTNEVHALSARVAELESEHVVATPYAKHNVWWYLLHPNSEVGN